MATIYDVARAASVSVATVSHVLNDSRFVAPETKERVLRAISSLRYRRHGIARSLRRSQTSTIGLMISDITNPFFADLVRGVENVVSSHSYNLILCNTEERTAKERLYLDVLLEKRVDGLIMAPAGGNEVYIRDLIASGFPTVFVDRYMDLGADAVIVNNERSSFEIVTHLIELGHRKIGVLQAQLAVDSIQERVAGYRAALARASIRWKPGYVVETKSSVEAASVGAHKLLQIQSPPTAVFCTNNFMTLGMVRALTESGLSCPVDMAVVGFDDVPWAFGFHPQLTVVSQPAYEMGVASANILFGRLSKKLIGPAITTTLHGTLIVRESSGALLNNRAV